MARTDNTFTEKDGSYIKTIWAAGRNWLINGANKYLNFNSISGETGYGIRDNGGTLQAKNSGGAWANLGVGGGQTNTASNLGSGEGVFKQKTGVDLEFKTLVGGSGITLSANGDEVTVDADGGGTTVDHVSNVATDTILGRRSAGSGNSEELTPTQVRTLIELGTAAELNTGTSNGDVPVLGSGGKLDTSVLPALAITDTFVVADEAAQLALTVQQGDIAVRTDESKSYIALNADNVNMADWRVLSTPTDAVQSVAGKTGTVSLVKGDVGLGNVTNTSDANKPVSTAQQTEIDTKQDTIDQNVSSAESPVFDIENMTLDNTGNVVSDATNLRTFLGDMDHSALKAKGTGVTSSYTSSVTAGGTVFAQGAVFCEISSDEGYFDRHYTGATGVTVADLTAIFTYAYIDKNGVLQQQVTEPTRQDWSRKAFTMRIEVDTSTETITAFEYYNNPIGHYANSIRDVVTFLKVAGVPFRKDMEVTGRAGDLGFDIAEGAMMEIGSTGNIHNGNIKTLAQVSNAEYQLATKTETDAGGNTDLVKFWDNAGTITALGSTTVAGQRMYRNSAGITVLQYGQGNYANIVLAKAGVLLEDYVLNPALVDYTFMGWWLIQSTATASSDTTKVQFVPYTIGIQGGSSLSAVAVAAINAAANSKATPIDADSFPIVNSASSNAIGRVTFTNFKAFLKTYFDSMTSTFTNKRITKREQTVASAGTVTPHWDNDDLVTITAQAVGLTLANPAGTPTDGQPLVIRILDNATGRTIAVGSQYRAIGVTIPTTTTASKTIYLGGFWNVADSKFDITAVAEEA